MHRLSFRALGWALLASTALVIAASARAESESTTVARCGQGFLEVIDGAKVLHVKGSPYEMGYQQGALLKDDIHAQVRFLLDVKAREFSEGLKFELGGLRIKPDPKALITMIAQAQREFVPERFHEEMRGVADGSGVPLEEIIICNFIPEMFHCSGFALVGSATEGGTLYHGRVLDYGTDWRLQDHAVLVVAEPEGKLPFVNVTYAGFIGSVTGMNAEQISIGEMGGGGLGHWAGTPMSFLVRIALEEATSLDDAIAVFRDRPRTCEYYYVIADGETGQAVGMEASWNTFGLVQMGEPHPRLPHAVPDAVLLSVGARYEELARRVRDRHGTIDAEAALRLMDRPVAMKSNLHNVLFETASGRLWVAHASSDGQPAATQPYREFRLPELLQRQPDPTVTSLELPTREPATEASPIEAKTTGG